MQLAVVGCGVQVHSVIHNMLDATLKMTLQGIRLEPHQVTPDNPATNPTTTRNYAALTSRISASRVVQV